jgi:hypothetical protein
MSINPKNVFVLTLALCGLVQVSAAQQAGNPASNVFSADSLMQTIIEYDGLGMHRSATQGDRDTADWMASRLKDLGYEVNRQPFSVPLFEPTSTLIRIGEQELEAFPQWPAHWTGPAGLDGAIEIFQPENPGHVKGRIALVDLPFRRHSSFLRKDILDPVNSAIDSGALAVVLVPHGPTGGITALNADGHAQSFKVPVVQVAPRDRSKLVAAIDNGKSVNLLSTGKGPSSAMAENVIGRLDRGSRWVIVSTPYSGWFHCAAERGPGIATFFALAHWVASEFKDYSFLFVATSGHELTNMGAHAFMHEEAPSPAETELWLHLGAGLASRDFHWYRGEALPLASMDAQRFLMANAGLHSVLREHFAGLSGLEMAYAGTAENAAGELKEIFAAGYKPAIGAFSANPFHHSKLDRPDKTAGEFVEPVALAFKNSLRSLLEPAATKDK